MSKYFHRLLSLIEIPSSSPGQPAILEVTI